jgi:menaquinone-specific isochorismate synthase
VRVQVPVAEATAPIQWLRGQAGTEGVYWSGRSPAVTTSEGPRLQGAACRDGSAEPRVVAGVGQADVVTAEQRPVDYDALRRRLADRLRRADDAVRYYGGLRFDAPQPAEGALPSPAWRRFGAYRFVLPRFELVQRGERQALACNLVLPRDREQAPALLEAARALTVSASAPDAALPAPLSRVDRPTKDDWTQMVRWVLDAIATDRVEKVVLARQVELALGRGVDPAGVLHHLKAATPGCFHFALRPPAGPAFLGASPERLFRWQDRQVVCDALAGTRGRGDTPEADAALREELLTSEKERREHAFVQTAIEEDLEAVCTAVEGPERPSELLLARGRHLHARLTGTLRPDVTAVELLAALHPTPAVGGVPRDAALGAIRAQEPFDRGWYAGPVGWIGADAAEFAVGIRSGLVWPDRLALYSGAGIVEGSVPDREWDEIEQKIADFAAVLGLLDRSNGAAR